MGPGEMGEPGWNPLLQRGMDVAIDDEYNRVSSMSVDGSLDLANPAADPIGTGAILDHLHICPMLAVVPDNPDAGCEFMPMAIADAMYEAIAAIGNKKSEYSADYVYKLKTDFELPVDPVMRKAALLGSFCKGRMFRDVSRAAYTNDIFNVNVVAGYYYELREVFCGGQSSPILQPFQGIAVRSMSASAEQLRVLEETYQSGVEVCWANFTPAFNVDLLQSPVAGNVMFRIKCDVSADPARETMAPESMKSWYFPASVREHSAFPEEDEIIFPPYSPMRCTCTKVVAGQLVVDLEYIAASTNRVEPGDEIVSARTVEELAPNTPSDAACAPADVTCSAAEVAPPSGD